MNRIILTSGILILLLGVGTLFTGSYTQLYAVVDVYQVDPNSLHIVPPYRYQKISSIRYPTTQKDTAFLNQKILEAQALYPSPEYIVQQGGWQEETIYPQATFSGIISLTGLAMVATSFAVPAMLNSIRMRKRKTIVSICLSVFL